MTKVYLIGTEQSPKTNQWLAMTNSEEEAARLLDEVEEACRIKTIVVEQGKKR